MKPCESTVYHMMSHDQLDQTIKIESYFWSITLTDLSGIGSESKAERGLLVLVFIMLPSHNLLVY